MATLTVSEAVLTGLDASGTAVAAAGGGDQFANDGRTWLYVNNAGATITVTIDPTTNCNQGFDHSGADSQVSVTGGESFLIGPFAKERFNDTSGNVAIAYSSVTSVTVLPIRCPAANI